ncbi:MAG: chemotaxis response regulator protein-glutamate methylesterase [Magnetococcales bacterium]|nr:chemotaxis response regulator protein-glutamate methylesterase [Magnetococcales bacterium]
MSKIKVLIVDDSALVRKVLKDILSTDETLEVVGTASDAWTAMQKVKELKPDVLTLDIVMPGMDGLDFLERLMKSSPMPVVMVSTLTGQDTEQTFRALALGAVDVIAKPSLDVREKLDEMAEQIIDRVKAAGHARIRSHPARFLDGPKAAGPVLSRRVTTGDRMVGDPIIAIGASTGGTDALQEVLVPLPENTPAILVVQHMLAQFTAPFAQRLDRACRMRVKEAEAGDRVQSGTVLVAPGGRHMVIVREGDHYVVQLHDGPMVQRVRPSVDVLFHSMATQVGRQGIGIILTGMGADGAEGMLAMKREGARTLAQDEASCVVFGMPKMAIKAGGVDQVLPVTAIPGRLLALVDEGSAA